MPKVEYFLFIKVALQISIFHFNRNLSVCVYVNDLVKSCSNMILSTCETHRKFLFQRIQELSGLTQHVNLLIIDSSDCQYQRKEVIRYNEFI